MKAIPLTAEIREIVGKKVKKLRKEGLVPATVFGKSVKSVSLSIPTKDFAKVYHQAGETGLVELKFGSTQLHTLISEVQFNPLTRMAIHVQFHAVNLKEKIKANVPLELVGESPAVASTVGILLQTLNEVEVEALPTDLPEKIEIDVTSLAEIDQQIVVSELKAPSGVEILTGKDELVVKVVPAVSEEAKKEAEEAAAKAAEEEAAEGGAAAPSGDAAENPASEGSTEEKAS
ncbi:50S ribosomal protein L25 [Candidatus Microgenomates bacterium]|nr:50S ribosomal protein L25 [Candidatus Microgenomates bacterium]